MTYEDVIRYAAEHKLDGVDLTVYWFPSTGDKFLYGLKQLAFKLGVEIYSISIRTDMCKRPGAEADKELAEARKWVDAAAKLGAGHIRVFGGAVPKDSNAEEAAGWVVQLLGRAAEYAGSKGIILGLENHGGVTDKAESIVTGPFTPGTPVWICVPRITVPAGNPLRVMANVPVAVARSMFRT